MEPEEPRSTPAPVIPVEQLRAAIRLLFPEEMTPQAKRVLESICEHHEEGQ